jgi:hypothetical protein
LRRLGAVGLLLAALLVPAASADNGGSDHLLLGSIPAHGPHVPPAPAQGPPGPGGLPAQAAARAAGATGTAPLTYHGGPVLHTNTTYAIYWAPSGAVFDTNYQSDITSFFKNVAAASGSSSNVYATDTQYTDGSGPVKYASTFGGAFTYAAAIPNNPSCVQQYRNAGMTAAGGCVLDSDIENVVSAVASTNNLPADGSTIYFVFTPKNVGSCFSPSGGTCAYNYYCAYHSSFSTSAGSYLYANMPYSDSSGVLGYQDCSVSNGFPNNGWADPTISITSHEHNETITDPYGNAWYDAQGNEDGDKCAWNFGAKLGSTASGDYNQLINGGTYYMQQEWSNASGNGSCVLTYAPPAPGPTITSLSPTSGVPGTQVTISGSNLSGASVSFGSTPATITSDTGTQITTSVPTGATSGPVTVTTPNGSASSAFTVTIPDFSIAISPANQSVRRGSSATYTVTISALNGFTGTVNLAISGVSGGNSAPTASLSPTTVVGSGTSTLTVSTRSNSRSGTFNVSVTGTSGTLKHSQSVTITTH